ncbi:hypothetical protein MHUMG1_08892 [Metarhizium humberi]|uniref:Uncharacterized protein n=1 Tax=Metarhizium humberi TaxID=2596975 RepID=A0A9P8M475_9HYPO|nr:hypothetical protein MHUMG1_08892 [Metarhizium humberi]
MSLPAVLAKYLREEIIGDVEFSKSIAEARSVGNQWILRRSYSKHPHTIQEEFRIEVRDQEHVRCTLKLNVMGHDAPREDTREKIFKPRAWCGPELDIEVSEQQTNLPQHLPTSNAREFASQANTSAPQTSIDDTATPAATESELDKQSDGVADEQDDQKQDNKVARYILLMAQYFVKGIRQCVKETQESDEAGDIVRLPALWRRWKKEGVKEDKIFSTTFSHTEELKRVSQYYGTSAMTIPTFLEIGGFSMTSFGHTTISSDESFFYDGLVSLIDLSWRRLAAAHTETDQNIQTEQDPEIDHDAGEAHSTMTEQDAVPVLNPFGFHSFYTEADYNATCKTLDQSIFLKAPQTVSYELPTSKILRKGRERLDSTSNGHPTSGLSDESSTFILRYAQRLAKHITHDEKVERTKGYNDNEENLELALRVLDGNALPEELATASITVVYIIVDILLDRCPKPKKALKENRVTKRKRASGDKAAECASGRSPSAGHCGPREQPPQWKSRSLESATESNLQVHTGIAHDEVNSATSSTPDQESFIPGFDDPAAAMLAAGSSNYANRPYDAERVASGTILSPVSASREPHIENALGQRPRNPLAMTVPAGLSNTDNQSGLTNTWSPFEFGMGMDAYDSLPPFNPQPFNPQLNTDNSWTGAGGMDIATAMSLFGSYGGSSDNLFQG